LTIANLFIHAKVKMQAIACQTHKIWIYEICKNLL